MPDLKLPEEKRPIGHWGRLHKAYLQNYRPTVYNELVLSCRLHSVLADLNEQANDRFSLIMEQTVQRLRLVAALAPDPAAKKLFFALAVKLNDKDCDRWYRCFFYNMRVEMERFAHHKYVPDSYPVPIMEGLYE